MLNLPIAMFNQLLISLVFLVQSANALIVSPQPGDVLRGQVEIVGEMNIPNFASAELAFSYASNPADRFTWFTIQTFSQPVQSPIATWDTTKLTDGDYILLLRVLLQDGSSQDVVVSDLKIRNDTPLPTASPTATDSDDGLVISSSVLAFHVHGWYVQLSPSSKTSVHRKLVFHDKLLLQVELIGV